MNDNFDYSVTFKDLAEELQDDFDALTAINAFEDARKNVHDVVADCRLIEFMKNINDNIYDSVGTADIIKGYLFIEIISRLKVLKQFDKAHSTFTALLEHYGYIVDNIV